MWCPSLLSVSYAFCTSAMKDRCSSREGTYGGRIPRPRQTSLSDLVTSEGRRPLVLRPPRQGSVSETDTDASIGSSGANVGGTGGGTGGGGTGGTGGTGGGGGVFVDRTSYHYMYQDVTAVKTMLLRLRRILQEADIMNPFDSNLRNSLYLSLASSDSPVINGEKDAITSPSPPHQVSQENTDLRRQVVLLQQQLEDKERTIKLLQQQISHHHHHHSTTTTTSTTATTTSTTTAPTVNAATQTDRHVRNAFTTNSLSRAASIDDGLGPTVSSEREGDRGRGRATSNPTPLSPHHPPRATSQPPPPLRPRPAYPRPAPAPQ